MDSFGGTIRKLRVEKGLPLRTVASYLEMDQAILSKIERGHRKASREHVGQLARYFQVKVDDLMVIWLSDKLLYELADEKLALKALQLAEQEMEYKSFLKIDWNTRLTQLKNIIKMFPKIQKAWIFGSFSRKDDGPQSDIDIAVETDEGVSYFDLAEIQYQLEKALKRKIDIGFIDTFKPHIFENLKDDLRLIYER